MTLILASLTIHLLKHSASGIVREIFELLVLEGYVAMMGQVV